MVVGKILGMAGKKLAKKFLSKNKKIPKVTITGRPYLGEHINAFQRVPAIGRPIKKTKKKKD
tara:strand:- start:439 stop:624 length:186 start_codon:yes stop_codon:yes gene_type:complete